METNYLGIHWTDFRDLCTKCHYIVQNVGEDRSSSFGGLAEFVGLENDGVEQERTYLYCIR